MPGHFVACEVQALFAERAVWLKHALEARLPAKALVWHLQKALQTVSYLFSDGAPGRGSRTLTGECQPACAILPSTLLDGSGRLKHTRQESSAARSLAELLRPPRLRPARGCGEPADAGDRLPRPGLSRCA